MRHLPNMLTEPVMTNMGVIYPDDPFLHDLRSITRKMGTKLIIDQV